MTVRMVTVEKMDEGPIRDGGRRFAQLSEPIETQPPHAVHILVGQARMNHEVGEQADRPGDVPGERGQRHCRGVGAHVDLELPADPRDLLMNVDGRTLTAAFVEHVAGQRCQTREACGIGRRSDGEQRDQRHQRQTGPDDHSSVETIWKARLEKLRKTKRSFGLQFRQPGPIDAAHSTTAGSDAGAASLPLPCGTTLKLTRGVERCVATLCLSRASVTAR